MKLNKILYMFAALCVATASASLWFFISTYHSEIRPPIDSIFFKWGDYGTLLSGVCTLAAALLSLATLLYLISFNRDVQKENKDFIKEQSALISRQMKLSELEQYSKHRELFNERLNHIEKKFERKFEFADPFQLYRAIFPNNNIGNTSVTCKIDLNSTTPTALEKAIIHYQLLPHDVEKHDRLSTREFEHFITSLGMLQDHFQLRYTQETNIPGDIFDDDIKMGINCFHVRESVDELTYVLNELLDFTKNEPINNFSANSSFTEEGLLAYFMASGFPKEFQLLGPLNALTNLYHIRSYAQQLQSTPHYADIHQKWYTITSSKMELKQLADKDYCKKLGSWIQCKIIHATQGTRNNPEHDPIWNYATKLINFE